MAKEKLAQCAACKSDLYSRSIQSINGMDIMLCNNAKQCTVRYRNGLSPTSYAKALISGSLI